jgi:ElaB/YqjD/DUF883 family membrane-anchored ribosome-binding protein
MDQQREDPGPDEAKPLPSKRTAVKQITEDIRDRASSLGPQAAEGMEHAAEAARRAVGSLRDEEAWLAHLVEQGADKLSDLAQTLRTNDLQTLLSRMERFARQQPVLFTGTAMAIGFALTRATAAVTRGAATQPSQEAADVSD